jgi:hypothetical protein
VAEMKLISIMRALPDAGCGDRRNTSDSSTMQHPHGEGDPRVSTIGQYLLKT